MNRTAYVPLLLLLLIGPFDASAFAKNKRGDESPRAEYLARVQQKAAATPANTTTTGTLWRPEGSLVDVATDFKAKHINDTIVIRVSEQTSAQSSGDVSTQRSFDTQSGISGLAGHVSTTGVNPILSAQSSTKLKGQGQTAANSLLRTSLTGQVIAVLPNGNLVIEAERHILMNRQHETIIVRGLARAGDIASDNSISSSALANLEIELKGKGIVSDATRSPNPLVRRLLWLIGF